MTQLLMNDKTSRESVMIEQNPGQVPGTGRMPEDTALQLFQIAALMLGDEQQAVSLVEETVAQVEADPCAEGALAYAEARSLLVHTAVRRMAGLYPGAFAVPPAELGAPGCIDTGPGDPGTGPLAEAGIVGEELGALLSRAGRAGMREWLDRLAPALRTIFVLRAVAGQDGEQTAENLRQSGATGAQGWRRDLVGTAYRQALCSLATCLVSSRNSLMPA